MKASKHVVSMALALLSLQLAGCQSHSAQSESHSQFNRSSASTLMVKEAAVEIMNQIAKACARRWELESPLNGMPPDSIWTDECYRDVIALAFSNATGESACSAFSVTAYIGCMSIGSYWTEMRGRLATAQPLSVAEWQDNDLARTNTIAALRRHFVVTCGTSGSSVFTACETEQAILAMGLSSLDQSICASQFGDTNNCLVDRSIGTFIKNKAMSVW